MWLRSWLRRGTILRLRRTILWLLRPRLWLLFGTELRLLLWLNRTGLRLHRPNLWLIRPVIRMYRSGLRLSGFGLTGLHSGTIVWVDRSRLRLAWLWLSRVNIRLRRPDLRLSGVDHGLTRSHFRLALAHRLDLWPVVWFARAVIRLTRSRDLAGPATRLSGSDFRLSCRFGTAPGVWACDAGLRSDGSGRCDHSRTALVHVVELLTVLLGLSLILELGRHGRNSGPAHGCDLSRLWPHSDTAPATVVGDACVVVDDDGSVVDVGDVDVDPVDGPVVVEVVTVPVAAVIADAGVAEAVVDAAVEADVQSPEAAMEAPAIVIPAPIAGGPEGTVVGWSAPGAGDPVVTGGCPVPVAGGPDVVGRGGDGLVIDWQRRRRFVGVFDRLALAFLVELVVGLSVLIGLVLILRWRWTGLLRRVLHGAHLRHGL